MSTMDKLRSAASTAKEWWRVARENPARTMKLLSATSGALLIVGGISGVVNIFKPLGIIISIYNILFGLLIVATELKSWPIIGAFQKRVDVYFHLLSVVRGKGAFYCFVGILAFCALGNIDNGWSVARVCVMIVSVVGVMHLLGYPKEAPRAPGLASSDDAQQHHSEPMHAAASATISDFALKVMQDNPDLVKQGLNLVASNPELAANAAQHAADRPPAPTSQ